jgi:hypothetical protein
VKIEKISINIKNINSETSLYKKFDGVQTLFYQPIDCRIRNGVRIKDGSTSVHSLCCDSMRNWDLFINYHYFEDVMKNLGIIAIEEKVERNSYIAKRDFLVYSQFVLTCIQRIISVFKNEAIDVELNHKITNTIAHIKKLINAYLDELGYNAINDDKETFLVSKEASTIAVAELYPQISEVVQEYKRIDLKGNTTRKKELLMGFANEFEPIRERLEKNKNSEKLASDLGFLFNNCHIRHNNKEGAKKKEYISKLDLKGLEKIYDKTYDYFLLAMLHLNYTNNAQFMGDLKQKIN